MNLSFEQTLVEVWRQALVENANFVELGKARYPVRKTPKRGLRQVDFVFDESEIRGLEQNPETMQFLSEGRYVANVVDGKVTLYVRTRKKRRRTMMQTGDKFLSVLAAVLIVLAFVLKAVIPQTYRLGLGAYFYRLDSIAFWVLLMGGLILGVIVALKIIMRGDAV